jgi:hypothetical protein
MARVFISYRNSDTGSCAGQLAQRLAAFQFESVFVDREAIGVGEDFADTIRAELARCQAVLVLMGPQWLAARDASGAPRLEQAEDWVRREVAIALRLGLIVVPVLVDDARLPAVGELPADITAVARLNTYEFNSRYFKRDADALATLLEQQLVRLAQAGAVRVAPSPMAQQLLLMAAIWFVAMIGTAILQAMLPGLPRWLPAVPGTMTIAAFGFWLYWMTVANPVRSGLVS